GTFEGHTGKVWSIVFAADGKSLFSVSDDKTLRRIDLASEKDKVLETFPVVIRSLARHGTLLAVGTGHESLVRLWDTNTEKEKTTIKIGGELAEKIAFDRKSHMLAEGGWGPHLALYESSGKLKCNLEGHKACVMGVAFSREGKLLVSVAGQWSDPKVP